MNDAVVTTLRAVVLLLRVALLLLRRDMCDFNKETALKQIKGHSTDPFKGF
jgi:hypothetical protein